MIRGFILKKSCFQLTQTQELHFFLKMGKWSILILEEFGDTTLRAVEIDKKAAMQSAFITLLYSVCIQIQTQLRP